MFLRDNKVILKGSCLWQDEGIMLIFQVRRVEMGIKQNQTSSDRKDTAGKDCHLFSFV